VNELFDELRESFKDEDVRYTYAEGFLNAFIAAQIKTLRGDMSQQELADLVGTKQSGISRLENVNYSAWKVETLRKLARAFHLRLRISFEEFGTLIPDIENFNTANLSRRRFEDDPAFGEESQMEKAKERETMAAQYSTVLRARTKEQIEGDAMLRHMRDYVCRYTSGVNPGADLVA
jgi:transcriptional regulator with XRE-family HTH domain